MERIRKAYDFAFYAYYRWFERQKEHPPRANELYAWAVLSLNGTLAASSIQSALIITGVISSDTVAAANWVPKFVFFGWPYPILLAANFRYFLASQRWRRIVGRITHENGPNMRSKFFAVAVASVALFVGSIGLSFKTM